MNGKRREQARRVSDFVDRFLLKRDHGGHSADSSADDAELRDLRPLLRCLGDVRIESPESFDDELRSRLPAMVESEASGPRAALCRRLLASITARCERLTGVLPLRVTRWRPTLSSAAIVLLIAAALGLLRSVFDPPIASASEVVSRSDAALGALVHPGQWLYRRWKVTSRSTSGEATVGPNTVRFIDEWMDGADLDRVAGRWYSGEGRLLIAYTSVGDGGARRPQVYFSPGVYGEARGVLNIEPTRNEFMEAVSRFPQPVQGALEIYLDRQYIYLPIVGERRFNRTIIEAPRFGVSELPRVVSSVDESETYRGQAVYRVRVVDPGSIVFNWRSQGPPRVRLAWVETVGYIARDNYLGLKTEETQKFEDGRQRVTTKVLVETRTMTVAGSSMDPFTLDVPTGTPVQRQSALEQLTGVANAFSRLPQFIATLEHKHTQN